MNPSDKISTDGGQGLGQNPFGALNAAGLPAIPTRPIENPKSMPVNPANAQSSQDKSRAGSSQQRDKIENPKNRGRLDIKRTTAGRGGKTVTIVTGFTGIGLPEKESLAKKMRNACGCGGTVKDGEIEIQGDQREKIAQILTDAGFRPVFAGG
jgi:translation initiation factor 1